MAVHIGTSGWHYAHWRDAFYPAELDTEEWLRYYSEFFGTVEINNSFYRQPSDETWSSWRQAVPEGFILAVKANRYITHMKKLLDPEEPVANLLAGAELLGDRLGPILFQLPPNWHSNPARLQAFLEVLPGRHRYAFEFRDPSWFGPQVYELLKAHDAALCVYHWGDYTSPQELTTDFVYVRLHGPAGPYEGSYPDDQLAGWAERFARWDRDVYCYFNNDPEGHAPQDALRLQQMVGVHAELEEG